MIYGGQNNIYLSLVVDQTLANLVKVACGEAWKSVASNQKHPMIHNTPKTKCGLL
jgi:hypothetical protein